MNTSFYRLPVTLMTEEELLALTQEASKLGTPWSEADVKAEAAFAELQRRVDGREQSAELYGLLTTDGIAAEVVEDGEHLFLQISQHGLDGDMRQIVTRMPLSTLTQECIVRSFARHHERVHRKHIGKLLELPSVWRS